MQPRRRVRVPQPPQAPTCQRQPRAQPPPQGPLLMPQQPSGLEPAQQQVQQRRRVQVPEQPGLRLQPQQASQRWPRRIRALRSLASSCRLASIGPMRPSKPNRLRCCASYGFLGLPPTTRQPTELTMQPSGSISYILLSYRVERGHKRLAEHCRRPQKRQTAQTPILPYEGVHERLAEAFSAIRSK